MKIQRITDPNGNPVYPITHFRAIVDNEGNNIETYIQQTVSSAARAMKTAIVVQTAPRLTIQPNVLNVWENPISSLDLTLASGEAGLVNEYMIQFTSPSNTGTQLTITNNIRWVNDEPLEPEPNITYQVSIVDGLAVYAEWEAANT